MRTTDLQRHKAFRRICLLALLLVAAEAGSDANATVEVATQSVDASLGEDLCIQSHGNETHQ